MEDVSGILSGILSNSDTMDRLRALVGEYGGGASSGGAEDMPAYNDIPESGYTDAEKSAPSGAPDLSSLLGIGKLLGELRGSDANTELIRALEPHLSGDRREKAEEAIRVLRLIRMIPLLRESGLMDKLL